MAQPVFVRTLVQISSVLQNVLNQLPEEKRSELLKAISTAIETKTPVKDAIDRILDSSEDPLAQLEVPKAS